MLKVMSIMAHQDDFEFEAAGFFIKLRQHYGDQVALKILTTSQGGSGHHIYDFETTTAIRAKEAQKSAAIIGAEYENLVQLDGTHVAHQVFCDFNMLGGLWNAIRAFQPDYIVSPPISINPLAGVHIDHQHTAEAVRLVAYQLGVPNAYPTIGRERLLRYKPPIVLNCIDNYSQEPVWHFRTEVTENRDTKLAMLRCHKSQVEEWLPFVNNLDKEVLPPWNEKDWIETINQRHLKRNALCNMPGDTWNEYLAISSWGSGSASNPDTVAKIKRDFPWIIPAESWKLAF